jgi:hypothetical protein
VARRRAGPSVQWLTVQVTTSRASPAVIIAGADEISRPHLERLSDACDRRGIPLTLLFRHMRETAAELAGGGAAEFMRLGNHEEATAAADLIGRQHKFVLSQLTATLGGNQTHTRTDTEGGGEATTTTAAGRTPPPSAAVTKTAWSAGSPAGPSAAASPHRRRCHATGPPPLPGRTGPTGPTPNPPTVCMNTWSNPRRCNTCPITPCCSPPPPAPAWN